MGSMMLFKFSGSCRPASGAGAVLRLEERWAMASEFPEFFDGAQSGYFRMAKALASAGSKGILGRLARFGGVEASIDYALAEHRFGAIAGLVTVAFEAQPLRAPSEPELSAAFGAAASKFMDAMERGFEAGGFEFARYRLAGGAAPSLEAEEAAIRLALAERIERSIMEGVPMRPAGSSKRL